MGSIIPKPKAPKIKPLPPPKPIEPVEEPENNLEAEKAKQRRQNLLRRDRGVLGTVNTSLGGVLSDRTNTAQRKTLLGE